MKKYKVVFTDTGNFIGTDLTREEAEKLARQVTKYQRMKSSGRSVRIEEIK